MGRDGEVTAKIGAAELRDEFLDRPLLVPEFLGEVPVQSFRVTTGMTEFVAKDAIKSFGCRGRGGVLEQNAIRQLDAILSWPVEGRRTAVHDRHLAVGDERLDVTEPRRKIDGRHFPQREVVDLLRIENMITLRHPDGARAVILIALGLVVFDFVALVENDR